MTQNYITSNENYRNPLQFLISDTNNKWLAVCEMLLKSFYSFYNFQILQFLESLLLLHLPKFIHFIFCKIVFFYNFWIYRISTVFISPQVYISTVSKILYFYCLYVIKFFLILHFLKFFVFLLILHFLKILFFLQFPNVTVFRVSTLSTIHLSKFVQFRKWRMVLLQFQSFKYLDPLLLLYHPKFLLFLRFIKLSVYLTVSKIVYNFQML